MFAYLLRENIILQWFFFILTWFWGISIDYFTTMVSLWVKHKYYLENDLKYFFFLSFLTITDSS